MRQKRNIRYSAGGDGEHGRSAAAEHAPSSPVRMTNREGRSPFVLVCDHASNFMPDANSARSASTPPSLTRHIAWDPGALPVAAAHGRGARCGADRILRVAAGRSTATGRSTRPTSSRRSARRPPIPGNRRPFAPTARERRIALSWQPFHDADRRCRLASGWRAGRETRLVSVHSFTPVYKAWRGPGRSASSMTTTRGSPRR